MSLDNKAIQNRYIVQGRSNLLSLIGLIDSFGVQAFLIKVTVKGLLLFLMSNVEV